MAGPYPAKFELDNTRVYIHVKDEASGANVTRIDVEHPAHAEIIHPNENSFVGGKEGGVFIGLQTEMIKRAETYVETHA